MVELATVNKVLPEYNLDYHKKEIPFYIKSSFKNNKGDKENGRNGRINKERKKKKREEKVTQKKERNKRRVRMSQHAPHRSKTSMLQAMSMHPDRYHFVT